MSIRIVIIGAGEVGYNLSKYLSKEDYDITVVDIDDSKCSRIQNTIDANVIHGNGASQRVLKEIDLTSVDYFLALTPTDEVNLIASKTAKTMGAKKVIARLRNTEYSHSDAEVTPKDFDINYVSYPEKAAQKEIESLIRTSSALEVIEFNNKLKPIEKYLKDNTGFGKTMQPKGKKFKGLKNKTSSNNNKKPMYKGKQLKSN